MASTELEKRKKTAASPRAVSPQDEPSAEWGWHGGFPKGTAIAGIFTGLSMFAMMIGNHNLSGSTADFWLVGTGVGVLAGVAWMIHRRRTSWRR